MYKQWTENEIKYLKENYLNMTNKELAEKLNRTKTAIDIKINKLGLKKSKYTYNENYFKEINSEEKAYWLGFIYADGYITNGVNGNKYNKELGIELQKGDYKHLKKFNKSIEGNVEVTYRTKVLNDIKHEMCLIRLYSKFIVKDLIKLGVTPNKSLTIKLPQLNEKEMPHFIRGYFDGDGCITKSNHKNGKSYVRCDFTCGSETFTKQLRIYLNEKGIKSYVSKEKNKPYRLMMGGMVNCDNFLKYIYNNSTIYLDRKYFKKNKLYEDLNINERIASLK